MIVPSKRKASVDLPPSRPTTPRVELSDVSVPRLPNEILAKIGQIAVRDCFAPTAQLQSAQQKSSAKAQLREGSPDMRRLTHLLNLRASSPVFLLSTQKALGYDTVCQKALVRLQPAAIHELARHLRHGKSLFEEDDHAPVPPAVKVSRFVLTHAKALDLGAQAEVKTHAVDALQRFVLFETYCADTVLYFHAVGEPKQLLRSEPLKLAPYAHVRQMHFFRNELSWLINAPTSFVSLETLTLDCVNRGVPRYPLESICRFVLNCPKLSFVHLGRNQFETNEVEKDLPSLTQVEWLSSRDEALPFAIGAGNKLGTFVLDKSRTVQVVVGTSINPVWNDFVDEDVFSEANEAEITTTVKICYR